MPRTAPEAPWPLLRCRNGLGSQMGGRAGAGAAAAGTKKSRTFRKRNDFGAPGAPPWIPATGAFLLVLKGFGAVRARGRDPVALGGAREAKS